MRLIVGLGNPGKEYSNTKHNVGFMSLDAYAEAKKIKYKKSIKFTSEIAKLENAILLKPKTFMNNSGLAIRKAAQYYNITPENILIIFDDLNLPFAKLRLRFNGSAGGHNGIKSVITHLQTQDFNRLRVGIGRDESKEMRTDVLSEFSKQEKEELAKIEIDILKIIDDFVTGESFEKIMNDYN